MSGKPVKHGADHAPGGFDPIPATGGWTPNVDALTGNVTGDDYLTWSDNAQISDPGGSPPGTVEVDTDTRIVYFPAATQGWPHAVYEVEITGSDVIAGAPYVLNVYALKGHPGTWAGIAGGGFPGTQLAFAGSCYGFWNNFANTDKDPLIVRFLYHCFGNAAVTHNAIVAKTVGAPVGSNFFEITVVQVHPGTP